MSRSHKGGRGGQQQLDAPLLLLLVGKMCIFVFSDFFMKKSWKKIMKWTFLLGMMICDDIVHFYSPKITEKDWKMIGKSWKIMKNHEKYWKIWKIKILKLSKLIVCDDIGGDHFEYATFILARKWGGQGVSLKPTCLPPKNGIGHPPTAHFLHISSREFPSASLGNFPSPATPAISRKPLEAAAARPTYLLAQPPPQGGRAPR